MHQRWFLFSVAFFVSALLLPSGCSKPEEIEEMRIPPMEKFSGEQPRPKAKMGPMMGMNTKAGPKRIMGAIIHLNGQDWYLKAMTSPELMKIHEEDILKFIRSIKFNGPVKNPMTWTVPSTWKKGQGNQFSSDAFLLDEATNFELTVSSVGGGVLQNLNRWRDQTGLPNVTQDQISTVVKEETIDGKKVLLVDFAK